MKLSRILIFLFLFDLGGHAFGASSLKSMIDEADALQMRGDFEAALNLFRKAEKVCIQEKGLNNPDMQYILGSIAACADALGDMATWRSNFERLDSIGQKIGFEPEVPEEMVCYMLAGSTIWDSTDDAFKIAENYIERGRKAARKAGNDYVNSFWTVLERRMNYIRASQMADVNAAAPILEKEYKYFTQEARLPREELILDIMDCGLKFSKNLQDRVLNKESLDVLNECNEIIRTVDPNFYSLEIEVGRTYALSNMREDEACIKAAEDILSKNPEDKYNYELIASARYNLGRSLNDLERYEEGYKTLKGIFESPYINNSEEFDFVQAEIANSLWGMGKVDEAKTLCEDIIAKGAEGLARVHANYILSSISDNQNNAISAGFMDSGMTALENLGYRNDDYAYTLMDFADRYTLFYQYDRALEAINKAVKYFEDKNLTNNTDYYLALARQASVYTSLGDIDGMTTSYKKLTSSEDFFKKLLELSDTDEIQKNKNLHNLLFIFEEIFQITHSALKYSYYYFEQALADGDISEEEAAYALQSFQSFKKQYYNSMVLITENPEIYHWALEKRPGTLAVIYHAYAAIHRVLGEYEESLSIINHAIDILPKNEGYTPAFVEFRDLVKTDMDAAAMKDFIAASYGEDIAKLKEMLSSFTSAQRSEMWRNYYGKLLSYSQYAEKAEDSPELNELAYNSILVSKGLLLQADIDFETRLQRSNDEKILAKYQEWKTETSQASEKSQTLEHELIRLLGNVSDNESFRYTWKDVKANLKDKEYAIEFRSYDNFGRQEYLAFVVGKDYTSPRLLKICNSKDLNAIGTNDSFDFKGLSNLVWRKFDSLIPAGSTVYFSPDMQLHSFPLENLPDYSDNYNNISDRWTVNRLSSTRQIAQRQTISPGISVDIFGGMEYSIDPNELKADYNKNSSLYRSLDVDTEDVRGIVNNVQDLPGSKREVQEIAEILKSHSTPLREFTGKIATEAGFKARAGKEGNILHMSTHGFFIDPSLGPSKGRISNILSLNSGKTPSYDDALNGSGLMMAGVNEVISGKVSSRDCEDGLLTAKEISGLDLKKLDFVVLSACETGVGAVSGDGVFGLQRGFKLAGAKSIMMSLWKVDDNATEKLMTEFYRNWTGGLTLTASLKQAQKTVRETPGWEDPKYWAAFILLDAI